ncbi:MAG: superoxide dismutase, Ni [Pseudomonadota bacterium]
MKAWFAIPVAKAHCDVPCGIYDPSTAQLAAMSVARFLDQIEELVSSAADGAADQAKLARLTAEKEKHAQEVKAAVVVIWGDYFKPPHTEKHPELHELTHQIMRKASACKQELNIANGRELVELVNRFAEIFFATKEIPVKRVIAPYEPRLELITPDLNAA